MTATPSDKRALVLFSGGQDSTTCLAWALRRFPEVETVGFDYGQRHAVELECRAGIREALSRPGGLGEGRLGPDHRIELAAIGQISETALTRDVEIAVSASGLPTTFVPGRNLVFLAFAAALAYRRGCRHIVLGVCETDYSGYPDCRDDTIKAMQVALNLGLEARLVLHTPLMWRDKAETFALAESIGGAELLRLIVEATHTCYLGDRSRLHEWGYGCGSCPACRLRADGFARWRAATGR
ncbi:7-cyano-7-deazaguanine synthase QueC [Enterovirga aerilata]|uniref:7-cyano-7-deazaguanine synthase n=1 Tax=Enterovirga aerilata TaxID=2730920 RepID=A0A849I0H6_9HYPH|nr:7-cyano-7-deazaguanine synthase QueC [Enterovirga sp. DB1703]NNM70818.1 7-cyano-7-deazaguanine synthase QueC [Enterovirga sp. DB1703]